MKKFFAAVIVLVFLTSSASAEVIGSLNVGGMETLNVSARIQSLLSHVLDSGLSAEVNTLKYYDSLTQMQLALGKGEITAIITPEIVGEYMLKNNPEYKLRGFMITKLPTALAMGFRDDNADLCARFSKVIEDMEREGVIGILARDYITGPAAMAGTSPAVKFEHFDGAQTITVALTGDIPPVDYAGTDGEPAGFNTAILAEIGRRLHLNIKTIMLDTVSRVPALKSGRADVVFWFQIFSGYDVQPDVPEGVITSTPYYGWNKAMMIGKK